MAKIEDISRPRIDSHNEGNLTISFQKSKNDYFKGVFRLLNKLKINGRPAVPITTLAYTT